LPWSLFLYVSMAPTTPFSLLFASPFSPPFIGSTPVNVLSPLQDPFGAQLPSSSLDSYVRQSFQVTASTS
jgi:hypothetical protein